MRLWSKIVFIGVVLSVSSGCGFISPSAGRPSQTYSVPNTPRPIIDPQSSIPGAIRNRVAIVIGISRYKNGGEGNLQNLKFADADADAVGRHMLASSFNAVRVLTNEKATRTNITTEIRTRLIGANEDDFVLLFWAGHGCVDEKDPSKSYFLTYDSDPDELSTTAYSMTEFQQDVANCKARRLLVVVDACHSGGISDPSNLRGKTQGIVAALETVVAGSQPQSNQLTTLRLVLTACRANEVSREDSQLDDGHGVFTYFFLQALQGEANKPENHGAGDGKIRLGEVLDYLSLNIPRQTRQAQHPAIGGAVDRNLVIGKVTHGSENSWGGPGKSRIGGSQYEHRE